MKAISLWQPWASLVVQGIKTIETRTHTRFSCLVDQRIAIHAAKKWDEAGASQIARDFGEGIPRAICPAGAIVGTVWVDRFGSLDYSTVHIVARTLEFWQNCSLLKDLRGRWGLWLKNPVIFAEPKSWKGRQGIFNVDDFD